MPRGVGLDRARVVAEAAALIDAEGVGALGITRLAARVGVRPPSLFKHIDGLEDLTGEVAALAYQELDAALDASGGDLVALARAWREFAHRRPGVYQLAARTHLELGPAAVRAGTATLERLFTAMAAVTGEGEPAVHGARALRALIHGHVLLELGGGFGLDVPTELSFERAVGALLRGLAHRL